MTVLVHLGVGRPNLLLERLRTGRVNQLSHFLRVRVSSRVVFDWRGRLAHYSLLLVASVAGYDELLLGLLDVVWQLSKRLSHLLLYHDDGVLQVSLHGLSLQLKVVVTIFFIFRVHDDGLLQRSYPASIRLPLAVPNLDLVRRRFVLEAALGRHFVAH